MNLYGNRRNEKYTYKRVSFSDWQEYEEYDFFTGGNIEYSADAGLKVTGSFDIDGTEIPDVNDLVRIYYSFMDDNGETESYPLATLFMSYSSLKYKDTLTGVRSKGSVDGSSVLKVLEDKKIGIPTAFSGNAIYEAQRLIQSVGLNVRASDSSFALSSSLTFDSGTSYLDIVNSLCEAAGFSEARPDAYGNVLLTLNIENRTGDPVVTFINDSTSIMYPEIEQNNDWQSTPNVVRVLYNDDSDCVAAWAINWSGSRSSVNERGGREITEFEEVSDLGDTGDYPNLLMERAKEILIEKSADVEYVIIEHAYVPISLHDTIAISYSDMEWVGNAYNFSIQLEASTKTQLKIKKTSYQNMDIETNYITYREAE